MRYSSVRRATPRHTSPLCAMRQYSVRRTASCVVLKYAPRHVDCGAENADKNEKRDAAKNVHVDEHI
eukprot:2009221-Pleurochrysis_carterae.AAC.1